MNVKEQLIKLLKEQLNQLEMQMPHTVKRVEKLRQLVTATETAIFELPNEFEFSAEVMLFTNSIKNKQNAIFYTVGFGDCINFILNYKKPETNEQI